ncbi:TetR/AcrR family transcriptional regulator [Mesorhizobium sp. B1-1-8]|uniref:TetR/AcrR family transcriptional regulator n=1 Tax=Mesorhizobium sp. B1-1-8 TaxID=2589976 RepID=UPI00112BE1D3|nr:TetR/AcrR family transcriptional regulator [Mesorhizobium sp. B1-1-8]UCI10402.1 TetR/AcrR family transcriptional regulator [Mesorhizobium sp. B1-1-8]
MARTIAFDYERALDKAMRLFWKHGYAGTGLRDLLKIMGIGEGSFYNTLKSKKQLYLACVERYEETEGRKRAQALMSAPTASQGIRALFGVVLDCLDNPQTPSRLCMSAAMASEEVLSEPDLRQFVEDRAEKFQASLAERLSQDRDKGALPATFDPQTKASIIATYMQGIWRVALVDFDRPRFERQIDVFLTGLGL